MSFFFEPGTNYCIPQPCTGCNKISPYVNKEGVEYPDMLVCNAPDVKGWMDCPYGKTPEQVKILRQCHNCAKLVPSNDGQKTLYACQCPEVPEFYGKLCDWNHLPDLGKPCAFKILRDVKVR